MLELFVMVAAATVTSYALQRGIDRVATAHEAREAEARDRKRK